MRDLRPELQADIQGDLKAATRNLFLEMNENELLISVGHTPMIELTAFAFDPDGKIDRDLGLKELSGFLLQEKDGEITVVKQIG